MSERNRRMLLGAAQMSRRGSHSFAGADAEALVAPSDEEAVLGGGGGGGGMVQDPSPSALTPAPSHEISVMPTVVENRQGVAATAAPPRTPPTETAERKAESGETLGGAFPEAMASPSLRFRGAPLTPTTPAASARGPLESLRSLPYAGSGGEMRGAIGGASTGGMGSSGHGKTSVLSMFKKASQSFSHHNSFVHQRNSSNLRERRMPARGKSQMHFSEAPVYVERRNRSRIIDPAYPELQLQLTEEDEAMLSDSEADYDAFDDDSERVNKKLFSPNFRFFRWYATFSLIMLLCFVFYMPIRIAFFPTEGGSWSAVDLTWNILFIFDVIIHLNTGFIDSSNGTVVYDRAAIFWRYAKGWLIVDLLAAFPFTFLPGLGPDNGGDDGSHEIAYLLSLPKMFRVYWLMNMAQENHRLHEGAFMAVRTLLSVVVTAQLFGCGWYMLATLLHRECEDLYFEGLPEGEFISANGLEYTASDYIGSECTWIYRNDYVALSIGRRYLGSVYWALTTLTTVGYGDLSARTPAEQIYSMAVQIVGVSWYGYIVGTWASVLNSFDRKDKEQRSKMREVVAFSKAAGLPPDMAKKVRQHFRFALYRQDNWITFNEQELVSDMPSGLRADVVTHVHANTIAQIPWLEGKDKEFVADMVILLKPRLFVVGDALYRRGSQPEEMFFIASGTVMLKYKHNRVGYLRSGQMAGLIGLVSCEKHKITAVVTQKDAHCLGLSRSNFMELMESYPNEMQELVDAAKALARRVTASSTEAKDDLMSSDIVATLISKPKTLLGAPSAIDGVDRWTEPQHDTLGSGTESTQRGHLPPAFSQPHATSHHQHQHQHQQHQEQSAYMFGSLRRNRSESDGPFPNMADSSFASAHRNPSAGSVARSGEDSGDVGGGGGGDVGGARGGLSVEDTVAREVSRRMSAIEERLGSVMGRLEGFVAANGGGGDSGGGGNTFESSTSSSSSSSSSSSPSSVSAAGKVAA